MSKNKASEINISIVLKKVNKIVHHMVNVGIKNDAKPFWMTYLM